MALVAAFLLRVLHYIYYLVLLWQNISLRLNRPRPKSLTPRRRLPKHLSIILVVEHDLTGSDLQSCLLDCVVNAVDWCLVTGIKTLSIYEENGMLLKCSETIRNALCDRDEPDESSSESELQYPPTPPLSDYSESQSLQPAPQLDTRTITLHTTSRCICKSQRSGSGWLKEYASHNSEKGLTLSLLSRESSKPFIASAAQSLASRDTRKPRRHPRSSKFGTYSLTVDALDNLLECDHGLTSPDFMIVHPVSPLRDRSTPLELHGYPPWHIRLTEIYHNRHQCPPFGFAIDSSPLLVPLDEHTFDRAMDEFATAEMRLGK